MAKDKDNNQQTPQSNLPPARLPDGHQPVNTQILVRGTDYSGVGMKVVKANKQK
jgi:hypothetical protein